MPTPRKRLGRKRWNQKCSSNKLHQTNRDLHKQIIIREITNGACSVN
jgi:hypothetical protein